MFEPYQGTGGGIPQNTWQTWTPKTAGKWWMSGNPIVGNVTGTKACPQASPCSWAAVLAAYPKAGFNSGQPFPATPVIAPQPYINFKAGSAGSWPGFVGNVDDFGISIDGSVANFDFEPTRARPTATSRRPAATPAAAAAPPTRSSRSRRP